MGYQTEFTGRFELDRPLTPEHAAYLRAFNRTRRMKRDAAKTALLPDDVRIAAGLSTVGADGGYFVGSTENFGQHHTPDIADYNDPPSGQPGRWCQWTPSEDVRAIIWDYGEKFYHYTEWIQYLITHFLAPWGYVLNGEIEWEGEDREDLGKIVIADNVITVKDGTVVYLPTLYEFWSGASEKDRQYWVGHIRGSIEYGTTVTWNLQPESARDAVRAQYKMRFPDSECPTAGQD